MKKKIIVIAIIGILVMAGIAVSSCGGGKCSDGGNCILVVIDYGGGIPGPDLDETINCSNSGCAVNKALEDILNQTIGSTIKCKC